MRDHGVQARPDPLANREIDPAALFAAYVSDDASAKCLERYLTSLALPTNLIRRGGVAAAIQELTHAPTPSALLIDISGIEPAVSMLRELAELCAPGVSVMAIGDRNDVALYRDLIRSGVQDYIVKPLPQDMLQESLNMLLGLAPLDDTLLGQRLGKIVTVVGTRGGIGATTIATNLSWGLANRQHRRVALVDLNLQSGACGLMLGVDEPGGLREALERPQRIDRLFLERAMIRCDERLSLLACKTEQDEAVQVDPHALALLVSVLRKSHHYVIVDVPRSHGGLLTQALDLACTRIVVVDQTTLSLRDMLGLRPLVDNPREDQKNLIILNRWGEVGRDGISQKEIAETLGIAIDAIVPFDARNVVASTNAGVPVMARSGEVTRALTGIITLLGGTLPPPPPRRWWQWPFKGRR